MSALDEWLKSEYAELARTTLALRRAYPYSKTIKFRPAKFETQYECVKDAFMEAHFNWIYYHRVFQGRMRNPFEVMEDIFFGKLRELAYAYHCDKKGSIVDPPTVFSEKPIQYCDMTTKDDGECDVKSSESGAKEHLKKFPGVACLIPLDVSVIFGDYYKLELIDGCFKDTKPKIKKIDA